MIEHLVRIHPVPLVAICVANTTFRIPKTLNISTKSCNTFIRTNFYRDAFDGWVSSSSNSTYCYDADWYGRSTDHDTREYLCIRNGAPALSSVAYEAGTSINVSKLSPVIANSSQDSREEYIAWHQDVSWAVKWCAVREGNVISSSLTGGKDTPLHLLVFDVPPCSRSDCSGLYKWSRSLDFAQDGTHKKCSMW